MKTFLRTCQILTLAGALSLAGGVPAFSALTDKECIERVVENFLPLTKIPRASHHEQAISSYLFSWAKENGFSPLQDKLGNIIFDIPATPGLEKRPCIALQCHMDMVAVGLNGFDPVRDHPIAVIEGKKMRAKASSLGADDGIGIALLLSVAQGHMAHGPLRAIITVDEEDTMTGVRNLDASALGNAVALINLDEELADIVTVSTASTVKVEFESSLPTRKARFAKAYTVKMTGLRGGHSGSDIEKGRANATLALCDLLQKLSAFDLASLEGGKFANAIPSEASACVVVNDPAELQKLCRETVLQGESELRLTVTETTLPEQVLTEERVQKIFTFLKNLPNGVQTMSKEIKGLVESSSNLGIFRITPKEIFGVSLVRSSSVAEEAKLVKAAYQNAENLGLRVTTVRGAEAWAFRTGSKLLQLAKEVYREQNGKEIKVNALHAGLECGFFAKLNPKLEMIAIGPTLHDVHSVKEVCDLESIPMSWRLLEGILQRYQ